MQWGKRPTAMIMSDEWFGHRDYFTGEPDGDRTEWTEWDFALARAYQTVEYYTDQNGIFQWIKEDPYVMIEATPKIDEFRQAVEKAERNGSVEGRYWVPDIGSRREDGSLWTYQEWVNSMREKDNRVE